MLCVSAVLLCLGTLQLSCSLPTPSVLAATFESRYPYPDMHGSPCGMKQPYKDLEWYQRQFPLKTRQRTLRDLDALSEISNLVEPDSADSRVRSMLLTLLALLLCNCLTSAPAYKDL